jgi:hypothetical protein
MQHPLQAKLSMYRCCQVGRLALPLCTAVSDVLLPVSTALMFSTYCWFPQHVCPVCPVCCCCHDRSPGWPHNCCAAVVDVPPPATGAGCWHVEALPRNTLQVRHWACLACVACVAVLCLHAEPGCGHADVPRRAAGMVLLHSVKHHCFFWHSHTAASSRSDRDAPPYVTSFNILVISW